VNSFNLRTKTDILYECLVLVIQSRIRVHTKWYESKIFLAVVAIVLIVVAIISLQPTIAQLAGAVATAGTAAMVVATLEVLAILAIKVIGVRLVAGKIVDLLGDKLAFLAAIVAIAASAYAPNVGLLSAEGLLASGQAVLSSVNESISEGINDIINEITEIREEGELVQENIDEAQKLLDNPLNMNVAIRSRGDVLMTESHDSFYLRTLNTDPVGGIMDSIDFYHESALALPQSNDLRNYAV